MALLYLIPLCHKGLKSLPIQLYCIDSDMNEHFYACLRCNSHRMLCRKQQAYGAVARRTYHALSRIDGHAVPQGLGCKNLICGLSHIQDLPFHGDIKFSDDFPGLLYYLWHFDFLGYFHVRGCFRSLSPACILFLRAVLPAKSKLFPEHHGKGKGNAHGQNDSNGKIHIVVRLHGDKARKSCRAQCLSQCLGGCQISASCRRSGHGCIEWILQFQCHTKHGWFRNA